jgi:mRNA-degrading endonuclease toxin of MazEF toxin-antitoxin module
LPGFRQERYRRRRLPEKPLAVLDRVTVTGRRSQFISRAVLHYVQSQGRQSLIQQDQIRTIDRQRMVERLGAVDAGALRKVDEAIKISLGLVDLRE